eukprot:m.104007 g.104007  ORF g.104007 m.104007 type:complete len:434 (-) comp15735_c0_seq1:56-1357(-)
MVKTNTLKRHKSERERRSFCTGFHHHTVTVTITDTSHCRSLSPAIVPFFQFGFRSDHDAAEEEEDVQPELNRQLRQGGRALRLLQALAHQHEVVDLLAQVGAEEVVVAVAPVGQQIELDRLVLGARGQEAAARRERDGEDEHGVVLERLQQDARVVVPQTHRLVLAAADEEAVVVGEGQRVDLVVVALDGARLAAVVVRARGVEAEDLALMAARDEGAAVLRYGRGEVRAVAAVAGVQDAQLATGVDVPHDDLAAREGGNQGVEVRRDDNGLHRVVAADVVQAGEILHLEDHDVVVVRAARKVLAVAREGHTEDGGLGVLGGLAVDRLVQGPGLRVPQTHSTVPGARGQQLAVGRVRQAAHLAGVALEGGHQAAVGHVPHGNLAFHRARNEAAVVRREGDAARVAQVKRVCQRSPLEVCHGGAGRRRRRRRRS